MAKKGRALTDNQQWIVNSITCGARLVHRVWTDVSSRGRSVSMRRREAYELVWPNGRRADVRGDSAERLARRGLVKIWENDEDDALKEFVCAVRENDNERADAAIQAATKRR